MIGRVRYVFHSMALERALMRVAALLRRLSSRDVRLREMRPQKAVKQNFGPDRAFALTADLSESTQPMRVTVTLQTECFAAVLD